MAATTQHEDLKRVVLRMFRYDKYLHALVITNSNGDKPVPFNKAYVSYKLSNQKYPSLAYFGGGIVDLAQKLKEDGACKGNGAFENLRKTLLSIVQMTNDNENLDCLKSLLHNESMSENSIRNTLAVHYFQPLANGSQCIIEENSLDICVHCGKKLNVGDTSLGHSSVWHGKADILVKGSVIKVIRYPEQKDDDNDDHEEDFGIGDIESSFSSNIVNNSWSLKQALAEAIVNGFCEGNKNKALRNKFIPTFLATEQSVRIIWYNVGLDVLLLSEHMPIWSNDSRTLETAKLNIDTLLRVWLALHFDNHDMGLKEEILEKTTHSNFKNVIGEDALSIYANSVAKPFKPFKIIYKPEIAEPDETDDFSFVFAKVKDFYYQRAKSILL